MTEQYQELLETLEKVIAHPHSTVVKHDRERAARAMLILGNFLVGNVQGGEDQFEGIAKFLSETLTDEEKKVVFPPNPCVMVYGGVKGCYNKGVPPEKS
jgi:hypothetical protein